jgi:hypothetical protein
MKTIGTIRRWAGSWGFCNVYKDANGAPLRFFVHRSKLVNLADVLDFDIRIAFVEGAPRRLGELPQALEIEIVAPINGGTR